MSKTETKEEAHDLFEQSVPAFLAAARDAAVRICTENGSVTIDDVREECPPPPGVDPRVMGAVIQPKMLRMQVKGTVNSKRKTCHKRPIRVFEFVGS